MDETAGYRGPQVCRIIGITYRQLDYWARTDLLRPSLLDAQGSGSQRMYSYNDLVQLKIVRKMIDAGIKLQAIRDALAYMRQELGEDVGKANVVIEGSHIYLAKSEDEIIDLINRGQGVLSILPLTGTRDELDREIASLIQPDAIASAATGASSGSAAPPAKQETSN